MSDAADWQATNDEYLGAGLAWIRARLEALAPPRVAGAPQMPPPSDKGEDSFWARLGRRSRPEPKPRLSGLLAPPRAGSAEGPAEPETLRQLEQMPAPPALILLSQRLGLSRFERYLLLLTAGMEFDTRIAGLCARAQDDPARGYPTFALAMALFDEASWEALAPDRPLRYWRLLEIHQGTGAPLTTSPLRADERVVNYLKGLSHLDDRLGTIVEPVQPPALTLALPPSYLALVERAVDRLHHPGTVVRVPPVVLAGSDAVTRRLIAMRIAEELGLRLHQTRAEVLAPYGAELEQLARLWDRESVLLPLGLLVELPDRESGGSDATGSAVDRFLRGIHGLHIVSRPAVERGQRDVVLLEVGHPAAEEQCQAWVTLLGEARRTEAGRLAAQFDLSLPAIQQAMGATDPAAAPLTDDELWQRSLAVTRPALDQLAQRIDLRATWEDLVLPADQLAILSQVVAQVAERRRVYDDWGFRRRMNRGLGISALFAGESGTGKTMAAEVIAGELRLDLYRIDLSQVVNKYIGETEKNLKRVFDAAEGGGAILLFDEADALFGKRSEVKDSHDRYANIEINYLLQRLESYRGLAILTTNQKGAMDQAFLRRLRFVVDFPFPGVPDRRRMWQQVFPAEVAPAPLDFERLARLALTGGSIHNVALNAAFRAAHAGAQVTMGAILQAARDEFRKLERPVSEAEFRWLDPAAEQARRAGSGAA